VTLGAKMAGWLDAVERHAARLDQMLPRVLVLQLGGAAGTLAALAAKGSRSPRRSLRAGLALPAIPWHAHRDRWRSRDLPRAPHRHARKIARDVSLLMQTEVAEAVRAGRRGSRRLVDDAAERNPVSAAVALAAAARAPGLVATLLSAMVQEHERGLGGCTRNGRRSRAVHACAARCARCGDRRRAGARSGAQCSRIWKPRRAGSSPSGGDALAARVAAAGARDGGAGQPPLVRTGRR